MPRFRIAPKSLLLTSVAALAVTGVLATTSATSVAAPTDEVTGILAEQHGDDFAHGTEVHMGTVIESGNKIVRVKLPKGAEPLGQRVRVKGNYEDTAQGKTLEVTSTEPVPAAALQAVSPGSQTVAVLLVNFSNNPSQPWTPAYARGVVFTNPDSVNALYQAASDGAVNVTGEVFGWYTLPMTMGSCDYITARTQARAAATAVGVNLAAYKYTVYAFPNSPCGWAGLGNLPGTSSWINGAFYTSVVGHELGHNFGVHHSSTLSCIQAGVRVTLSDACTASEYGDPFSVMGTGNIHVDNNFHRAELGWMPNQTVTTTGTYQLAPANGPFAAAPRYLQIPRGDGNYFHLEIRKTTPIFDNYAASAPVVNGVSIRLAPSATSTSIVQSKLLDTTPTTSGFTDSALMTGKTFYDQYGVNASNVKITTTAVSPSGATVSVEFAGSPPPTTTTTTTTTTTAPPTTTTTHPPTTTTTTHPPTTTTTTTTTVPPGPPGTPAFVKTVASGEKSQAGNATMTLTVPAGTSVATGHRVIVAAAVGTFAGAVGCSDNRGNTYAVDARSTANNLFVCSAHLTTALSAGDTITLTYPGFSGVSQATASDFTGIAASSALDGPFRAGASTSSKGVSVSPDLVTSSPNDMLFGAVGSNYGGFTVRSGFSSAGGLGTVAAAYRQVDAPASFSMFGGVGYGAWRSVLVAYRAK